MYVIIAGCGRVGSQLAEHLSYERHDVVVIDRDPGAFRRLGGTFNGITLEGVAFDEELLLEAGIEQADAFAAVTSEDNTNLMTAELATGIFKVPRVISRLYNPQKELTYFKMGVDYVCSTTLVTDRIRQRLFQSEETIVQQDQADVGIKVVEFAVGAEGSGKPVRGLTYGISSRLLILLRDNRKIHFDEDTPLLEGDRVVMTLRREGWQTVKECLGEGIDGAARPGGMVPEYGMAATEDGEEPLKARVILGGCSTVGAHLAYELSMEGHKVTIIDEDPFLFKRLPASYSGEFLEGVIYDEETLLAAGVERADAFVAVTRKDNKNLMAAEVARHVFEVPHVMARLFNPDKEPTYQALGMPYVCGTRLLAQALLERVLEPLVRTKSSCLFNKYDLVEFECPAAWEGKTVRHVVESTSVTMAYIVRRSTGYMPENNFILRKGDTINALVTGRKMQKLEKRLSKMAKG